MILHQNNKVQKSGENKKKVKEIKDKNQFIIPEKKWKSINWLRKKKGVPMRLKRRKL